MARNQHNKQFYVADVGQNTVERRKAAYLYITLLGLATHNNRRSNAREKPY